MAILNLEELKKQIKAGTFTGLESLENEFKSMLKEVLQETAQEELTSHLGYEKNQISKNTNSRNGYNKKKLNSKYGQVDLEIPRDLQVWIPLRFMRF